MGEFDGENGSPLAKFQAVLLQCRDLDSTGDVISNHHWQEEAAQQDVKITSTYTELQEESWRLSQALTQVISTKAL